MYSFIAYDNLHLLILFFAMFEVKRYFAYSLMYQLLVAPLISFISSFNISFCSLKLVLRMSVHLGLTRCTFYSNLSLYKARMRFPAKESHNVTMWLSIQAPKLEMKIYKMSTKYFLINQASLITLLIFFLLHFTNQSCRYLNQNFSTSNHLLQKYHPKFILN